MAETPTIPPAIPAATPPETPAVAPGKGLFAGKYETVEAMERGYKELESKLGQAKPAEAAAPATPAATGEPMTIPAPAVPADEAADLDVNGILSKAGIHPRDVAEQWDANRRLTDNQYAALSKAGHPKRLVDSYLEGQYAAHTLRKQEQGRMRGEAAALAGGEAELANLLGTAASFVPADELDDIRERLADPKRFKGAIRDVLHHHTAHVGAAGSGSLVQGGTAPSSAGAIETPSEFARLSIAAAKGDRSAMLRIAATPQSSINAWGR